VVQTLRRVTAVTVLFAGLPLAVSGCTSNPAPSPVARASSTGSSSLGSIGAQPTTTPTSTTQDPMLRPTTPSAAATHADPAAPALRKAAIWHPRPGLTWQYQLNEPVDTSVNAQVYDIDGTYNSAAVVATLHAAGRKVICYVNAGAYENFRPDAASFPKSLLGASDGWPGEQYLDIRQISVLRPIMAARFAVCAAKGFDAVEVDNVDGYEDDSGFPLTAAEQLTYNEMLAGLAHADGLAIGLKNDVDQASQLLPYFDFSIDEQCVEYDECSELVPFIQAGKAVFHVEYNLTLAQFCLQTDPLGFSSIRKNLALDAPRWPCP
jgi:hypothetical protein